MSTAACLAVDIGGTKLRAGLVAADGQVLHALTLPSNAAHGAAQVLLALDATCNALRMQAAQEGVPLRACGISSAGIIDTASGRVLRAGKTMPGWAGTDLAGRLGAGTGLPVAADNDVNCALRGELWLGGHGAAPGLALMLALGTGLGGALAHDGVLVTGAHQQAGHWGQQLVWHPLQGQRVELETLVSGSGLRNLYRLHGGSDSAALAAGSAVVALAATLAFTLAGAVPGAVLGAVPGAVLGAPFATDGAARRALDDWVELLAVQLHNVHWSLDPGLVLLGGGVVDSRSAWWPALLAHLSQLGVQLQLRPATLGNDAGMLGAAALAWQAVGGAA